MEQEELTDASGPLDTSNVPWDGANAENMSIDQLSQAIEQILHICRKALITIQDLPDHVYQSLNQVTSKEDAAEVYIAILGASGSGKSTLFNSILREYGVLPQGSGGQGCTAAPVEIRGARDTNVQFDIEVQYIDAEEFRADIVAAQQAMKSPSEFKEHAMSQVSKLEVVFPDILKDDLKTMTPEELLDNAGIKELLGSCEKYHSDEREKARSFLRKRIVATKQSRQPTLAKWPLVKVARVYVRSSFFKGRIVLTDVPGFGDSNKFRSARSRRYINGSAATCVITPASRGGTDAALSSMIRDSLQDIHFGGRYDKVLLVSTKSDAVSTEELEQDRDDDEREESRAKMAKLDDEITSIQESVANTRKKHKDMQAWERAYRNDLKKWKTIDCDLRKGRAVKIPYERIGNTSKFTKPEPDQKPLKHKAVRDKVQELKDNYDKSCARSQKLHVRLEKGSELLKSLLSEREVFVQQMNEGLITDRNATLKELQLDMYIEEIRNIDTEIREAAEFDLDQASRPIIPIRDYDQIRKSLPVFCTTARSYQNIKGYTTDAPEHNICKNLTDTGVPELRSHLTKIAQESQEANLRATYRDALEALNDLSLVVRTGLKPQNIDPLKAEHVNALVKSALGDFDAELATLHKTLTADIMEKYQTEVASNISKVKEAVKTHAKTEMKQWINPPKEGGFYAVEYKAALRRNGEWRGSRISVDFNDRFRLMVQKSAQPYTDVVFTNSSDSIRSMINACFKQCSELCQNFHDQNRTQMLVTGVSHQALRKLDDQLKLRTTKLNTTAAKYRAALSDVHIKAAAELVDDIREALLEGYEEAFEATADDFGGGITKLAAMHRTLYSCVKESQRLARPLRRWEKRMHDIIDYENTRLRKNMTKFVTNWVGSYEQALLNRSNKVNLSDDPGKDEIRNMIVDTRLIDDTKIGLAETSEEEQVIKEEEQEDGVVLVEEAEAEAEDEEMVDITDEAQTSNEEQTDSGEEQTGEDTDME